MSRLALPVSAGAAMLVALDGTVLLMAQPGMRRELGCTTAQLQWTSTGYLVAVAALLVLAGRLGDRYGHRRTLLAGVLGFGASSAGIALAPTVGWVVGLRVAQGVFGALLQPGTLALLRLCCPPERLGRAVAVRTGAIAVAAGAGPLLGGALVDASGWRAVFWINVPVAALIAVMAFALRPEREFSGRERPDQVPSGGRRLDLAGAALLAAALAVLVHALSRVPERGWGGTSAELAGAAALSAALVAHERRAASPVVPRPVVRSRPVAASLVLLLTASAGLFGTLFSTTFRLQDALGVGPLDTALRMLPLTALMVLGAPAAERALRAQGPRRTALAGVALLVAGIAGLAGPGGGGGSAPAAGAASALLGAGFAAVMVTATGTVVGDAPAGYAGAVGGLKQTAMNIGPTLGVATAAGTGTHGSLPLLAALAAVGLLPAAALPDTRHALRRGAAVDGA
ncbi:MFS transporter [Kitasatospora sp. SolWspMP-SS2h]|uniref:MFS transporter n=1 Tax=Kitasatospora sp. SolWspMP-SS2h TaxID=1305729 RepID=UPI000DC04014|nr:MFS transporter [Kitasatospora sp. SolWspMP-SS2h]RAJ30415.1 MFS transporter [Kitasatospora sp. SolWspMP-SS2h]